MTSEPAASIWETLAASAIAVFLRENAWAYPLLETLHMFGLALAVGGIIVFDLRLMGLARDISVQELSHHVIRIVLLGIAINIVTGVALFVSDAVEFSDNVTLRIKLALIVLAFVNASLYQLGPGRDTSAWDRDVAPPPRVKLQGALSIALWLGVVATGRMMAYLK